MTSRMSTRSTTLLTGALANLVWFDDDASTDRSYRVGHWLPIDHRKHKAWLDEKIKHVDNNPKELHPALKEFKDLIEGDTYLFMLVQSMFEQVPQKKPYINDPENHKQVRDYIHMLELFNHILTTAPEWSDQVSASDWFVKVLRRIASLRISALQTGDRVPDP